MTTGLARVAAGVVVLAFAGGACAPSASVAPASPAASVAPATTAAPATPATTPALPSPSPTPAALPDGLVLVDIPSAGIRLPVPGTWELVGKEALADDVVRADLVARYPGTAPLLEAAEELGDRASPALLVLDPAAQGADAANTPTVAVLVAQPPVHGPLLDFVAGFVGDGLAETFAAPDPEQEHVATPIGEAVRMTFELPTDGASQRATAWVVGAERATVVVLVVGATDAGPFAAPDSLIEAAEPLPIP